MVAKKQKVKSSATQKKKGIAKGIGGYVPAQKKIAMKTKTAKGKGASSQKKIVSLALQGGGSHGAYTWGVVDALLEDGRLQIEGVTGTSAGGMNAIAIVQGLIKGGNEGARKMLRQYWGLIGQLSKISPIQFNPYDKLTKNYHISDNPILRILQYIGNTFSPYQINPQNLHPMRDLIESLFDYKALQNSKDYKLFLCATHVATGKLKIFTGKAITPDALLASACVPSLFQAVQVDGEFYWDGGFIGNPPIYPLIYECETPDIIAIQIRRVYDPTLPTTVHDIANRLNTITQNACLTREMRAIAFISKLIDKGVIAPGKLKRLHMHMIRDDAFFGSIETATGFCADPDFLEYLFEAGRRFGKQWLANHFDSIGVEGTAHLEEDYV